MTRKIGETIIIEAEEDDVCELCGKTDELRPYGPNGKRICYECGMKNPEQTDAMLNHILFGDPRPSFNN